MLDSLRQYLQQKGPNWPCWFVFHHMRSRILEMFQNTRQSIKHLCKLSVGAHSVALQNTEKPYFILGTFTMLTQPQHLAFLQLFFHTKKCLLFVWYDLTTYGKTYDFSKCSWHSCDFQSLQRVPACPALNADLTGQNWSRSNVSLNKK